LEGPNIQRINASIGASETNQKGILRRAKRVEGTGGGGGRFPGGGYRPPTPV